ncbi:TetR/AcrR family transcriptional regulator [Acetobacter indonesiensis]|uniref:TetR/AcrR family transcriptional regulator n=1 Tax=Acetobacter indonesiensis TaxID=104101 RepID=UPI0020A4409C|nr:TetR/AcrR family transcriptional regulator [Acetobacter indonesiensis]MCP1231691.1 TetR/AcrR family transcriptional regulator [Acetobacter indonesiensis]
MSDSAPLPIVTPNHCTGESEAKRQQILDGARTIFAAHGFEGASMSAIARESGVSKGTLYNYFTNKADLFAAFVEYNCQKKLPVALAPMKANQPVQETLTAIARAMVHLITQPESLMLYRIIVSEAPHFPHLATSFWQHGPRIGIEALSLWIEEQVKKGTLTVEDPEFAAEQFFTLCQTRIAHRKRFNMPFENEDTEKEKVIHAAVKMFLATYGNSRTI